MVSRLFLFILPARTAIWKQFSRGLFVGLSEGRLFSHDLPLFSLIVIILHQRISGTEN